MSAGSAGSAAGHNLALQPPLEQAVPTVPTAAPDEFGHSISSVAPADSDWPGAHRRDDVLVHDGLLMIVNETLTPDQAMIEDLMFLRSVIDSAGLDALLVRGRDERPVIVIDEESRDVLEVALTAACVDEPFYAEEPGLPPLLLSDGRLWSAPDSRRTRLYRARVTPSSGLSFGVSTGIELQVKLSTPADFVFPAENSLTRKVLPKVEAQPAVIERFGTQWRTLAGMFEPHATDVRFDIDIVFSWVDGSDPEFRARRTEAMREYVPGYGDGAEARIRHIDELRYALRSVHIFAPWIRNIIIVTDSRSPVWLMEHPRVRVLRSEDFFSDTSVLPVYNSHAIESQLHHIPGLSEHFLYSNDDMFFGRSLQPSLFFSPGGVSKFIEAETRIGLGETNLERSGHENAARVNRRLLRDRFGATITRHLEHVATPLRVSVLHELEAAFPDEFTRTRASRFRASADISVTNSFYHYYALLTGRAVQYRDARVGYVDTTSRASLDLLPELLAQRDLDLFCLNDGSFPEVDEDERTERVVGFLERYFPIRAPWEREPSA